MNWRDLDPLTVAAAVSVFGFVFAAWLFVLVAISRRHAKRRDELIGRLDPETNQSVVARELRLWHEGGRASITVYDERRGNALWARFSRQLADAGLTSPPAVVLTMLLGLALGAAVLGYLVIGRVAPAVVGSFAIVTVFWWYLGVRASKRIGIFERQLVDALELSARALRAGHPLLGSFQLIADEIPSPVGPLFGDICQEHEMGIDLESALQRTARETDNADLRLFTASITINLRTGGNLAEVIEGLAKVIRERMKLQRRFRVLTAQTQISKRILTGMPVLMFFVLNLLNAEYMEPLYSTQRGNMMLLVAAGMLWGGWWIMNRMATITR